jgi:hypothetical protein
MKKISSKSTFFNKRIFPVMWFGIIGMFILIVLTGGSSRGSLMIPPIVILLIMVIFGYFFMKKLVFDLVDEVFDDGISCLLVRNKNKEERIDYRNIKNVNYTVMTNPHRATLSLRTPCKFGNEVSFIPEMSWIPFRKNRNIIELIDKVDKLRGG